MAWLRASGAKLALEVGLRELGVEQGHLGGCVAEQFHECGEADAGTKHLGGEGVSTMSLKT
jgi:hypothetical protein